MLATATARGDGATAARPAPVPCIRLFSETLLVDRGTAYVPELEEIEAPVIALEFDYGGTRVAAADPGERIFCGAGGGMTVLPRDAGAETDARCLLENLGAVELGVAEQWEAAPGSRADYLVGLGDDVHAACAFSAYALPQLRGLGWRVEVEPSYPFQLVETATPWYADVAADGERDDWFALELGTEIDGERINLLPALLQLLDDSKSLRALLRPGRRCVALPLGARRYLALPPERLRVLSEVLLELYSGEGRYRGARLSFSALEAAALARLDEGFEPAGGAEDEPAPLARRPTLRWQDAAGIRRRARELAAARDHDVLADQRPLPGLRAELRPYQREGVAWMEQLAALDVGGILADDMGLGKTVQTIAHLLQQKQRGLSAGRASLIVAPTSLLTNWQRELQRFAPALRVLSLAGPRRHGRFARLDQADVALTSYPLLPRDVERLAAAEYHLLVLDEAQLIKNHRSRTHRAARQLVARHRICLSGTPLENHLGELWSLLDFATPGLLGGREEFRDHFRLPIERGGDADLRALRLQALRERVAPFVLRRTKDQVVKDLPPKTEIVRAVELRAGQRELYESIRLAAHGDVRRAIAQKGMARSAIAILDALMKLRQVCCDPRLVKVSAARAVAESAKYELLMEALPRQVEQGRHVLVFSQFASMLGLIGQGLAERGVRFAALTGATRHRQRQIDAFSEGEVDVFLISLKAGGTGLNLVRADTVVHYDPWWNPAAQAQATDRAHRIGQTRPVFVYNLIVAGSVEEKMLKLQQHKRSLADNVLASSGAVSTLTPGQLDDLFGPLHGDG